jgi:hypothetical protein
MKIFFNHSLPRQDVSIGKYYYSKFLPAFTFRPRTILDILKDGILGSSDLRLAGNPDYINMLYHERDRSYMEYLGAFYDLYHTYDALVIQSDLDLIHPEFLASNFKKNLKCLHTVDDPHRSYTLLAPYSWTYDCASFISPSFNRHYDMRTFLSMIGLTQSYWLPLCTKVQGDPPLGLSDVSILTHLQNKAPRAIYCGAYNRTKFSRMLEISSILASDVCLRCYGNYPAFGVFQFLAACRVGSRINRPKYLSDVGLERLYLESAVGLNMHLSTPSQETGNMRCYEYAYYGVAQVCDTSQYSKIDEIFTDQFDILLYNSSSMAAKHIKDLIHNPDYRIYIAKNAYQTVLTKYRYEHALHRFGDWLSSVKRQRSLI